MTFFRHPIIRIVTVYAILSAAWIFLSDRLLAFVVNDPAVISQIQTYKGWLFILFSSAVIFSLVQAEQNGRQKIEHELLLNQASFQELFANNPNPMWVIEQETLRFLDVNEAAVQKYGYTRNDFLGMNLCQLIPVEDRPALLERMRKAGKTARDASQWRHFARSGNLFTVHMTYHPLHFNERTALLVVIEDMSYSKTVENAFQSAEMKRIAAENSLRLDEMRLEALLKLSQMAHCPLQEITDFALMEAVHLTDSAEGFLALVDPDQSTVTIQSWTGASHPNQAGSVSPESNRVKPEGLWEKVLKEHQPLMFNEESRVSWIIQYNEGDDALSQRMLVIPVVVAEQVVAIAGVRDKSLPYNDADLRHLTLLMDGVWKVVERNRLNEKTILIIQRLTILRSIEMAITSSLDIRVTLNILLEQISSHLNIDAAVVLLYSNQTQSLDFSAGRGFHDPLIKNTAIRLGESHAGKVALERRMEYIPDLHILDDALSAGLKEVHEDFTSYICLPLISKGQIKGVLELFQRSSLEPDPDWLDFLEAVAAQAAIAIDNAELFDQLQRTNTDLSLAYDATIEGWSHALELRSMETQGHTHRVCEMTIRLAHEIGLPEEEIIDIRRGVLLHDIGKMAIPDEILKKKGSLTDDEWEIMRKHPQYAYEMLSSIPYLRRAIDIPYCHHERWDGKGYPRGLKGDQIPLAARIFSIIDIWDALVNDRVYRGAWPEEKVLEYICDQADKRLDPVLVATFTEKLSRLLEA